MKGQLTTVNNYFDRVFCISLERRRYDYVDPKTGHIIKGRYNDCMREFEKHSIDAVIVGGVDGLALDLPPIMSGDGSPVNPGDIGCVLSHLKVLREARRLGCRYYLVFEDDVELSEDFRKQFDEYIRLTPMNWDMLYLGGSHMGPLTEINEHVARISETFTTHAIAVNWTVFDALEDLWSRQNEKVDISVASLHKKFNCYVFRPHIAFQRADFSDILGKHVDYQHLRK